MKYKMSIYDKFLFLSLWSLVLIEKLNNWTFPEMHLFNVIFCAALFCRISMDANFIDLIKYRSKNKNMLFKHSMEITLRHTIEFMGLFLISVLSFSLFNKDIKFIHYTLYYYVFSYLFILSFWTILNMYFKKEIVLFITLLLTFIQHIFAHIGVIGSKYYPLRNEIDVNLGLKFVINIGLLLILYTSLKVIKYEK